MESQYSSDILKYEKKSAFWFESRESTGVSKFPWVDCKKGMGGLRALHFTVLFYSCFCFK